MNSLKKLVTQAFNIALIVVFAIAVSGFSSVDPGIGFGMSAIGVGALAQDNSADKRVVDSVISSVARGYKFPMYAFPYLFPIVPVGQRGGKVIKFGYEHAERRNLARAPGANLKRLPISYGSETYSIIQRALAGQLPLEHLEEAAAGPGIAHGAMVMSRVMEAVGLQVEVEAAEIATKASNYDDANHVTLQGNAKWNNAASNPIKAIEEAKLKIANGIGMDPNILVLSPKAYAALSTHDIVRQEIYNAAASRSVDTMRLQSILNIEKIIVAKSRAKKDGEAGFPEIWGNNAILAYSDTSSLADMGSQSFGYTYRLNHYPEVRAPYFDEDTNSWVYAVYCEDVSVMGGPSGGYLWEGVG